MKTRYAADYVTEQAELAAYVGGEFDSYAIEYTSVYGPKLSRVIALAKQLNWPSNEECYFIRLEEFNNKTGWEVIDNYDLDSLPEMDAK